MKEQIKEGKESVDDIETKLNRILEEFVKDYEGLKYFVTKDKRGLTLELYYKSYQKFQEYKTEFQDIKSALNGKLRQSGLGIDKLILSSNRGENYKIAETIIDGKINWRRWVNKLELVSKEVVVLLDDIASATEDIIDDVESYIDHWGGDELSRLDSFLRKAINLGIISGEEFRKAKGELTDACK
jgi:hypothetical protein